MGRLVCLIIEGRQQRSFIAASRRLLKRCSHAVCTLGIAGELLTRRQLSLKDTCTPLLDCC